MNNYNPVKFLIVLIIIMVATFFVFWKGMGTSCLTSVPREEFEDDSAAGDSEAQAFGEGLSTVTEE